MTSFISRKSLGGSLRQFSDASVFFARRHPFIAADIAVTAAAAGASVVAPAGCIVLGVSLLVNSFFVNLKYRNSDLVVSSSLGIYLSLFMIALPITVVRNNDKIEALEMAAASLNQKIAASDLLTIDDKKVVTFCRNYDTQASILTWHKTKKQACSTGRVLAQSPEAILARIDGKLVAISRAQAQPK